jgi:hypothetical protein
MLREILNRLATGLARISRIALRVDRSACSVVGGVLIVAAIMKTISQLDWFGSPWAFLIIAWEAGLGVSLLAGIRLDLARPAAAATLAGFAAYSLHSIIDGRPSCGCFGVVEVNPRIIFVVDIGAAFVMMRATARCFGADSANHYALPKGVIVRSIAALPLGAAGAGWMLADAASPLLNDAREVQVIIPEEWIGQRLPLLDHVDIGETLSVGTWRILLYHHGCPKCELAKRRYAHLAATSLDRGIAMIEVPPYGESRVSLLHHGRLSAEKKWFVATPCELTVSDGQLVAVARGDSSSLASTHF